MQLEAYLTFEDNCAEAFRFYEKTLGGKIEFMQKFGESPAAGQVPAEWNDRILHALLKVGDAAIMGSDSPPGTHKPQQGIYVSVGLDDDAEAERIYAALADRAKAIEMPIQQTFWASRFAMLVDRFGTPWIINVSIPQPA